MFRADNNFEMNSVIDGNNNIIDNEMNIDIDMNSNDQFSTQMSGNCCSPITEAPQERCVHRTIVHEVPHV